MEEIRRIEIIGKRGKLSKHEAELFNRWIDVMYIASFPDIVNNVMDWFQGYTVFRVFGHGDFNSYTKVMNSLSISPNKFAAHDRYIWSPILYSLDQPEDKKIAKNKLYVNAFVTQERLGFKWKGRHSDPLITTTISYMEGSHPAREVYSDFANQFSDMPFIVLGKNSKDAIKGLSDKVTGYTDTTTFFSKIANSRMFIYLGFSSYYHLHFTPIEAMSMGVPVFFLERSGLTQEARDHGVSEELLKQSGMCQNIGQMRERVLSVFKNFEYLEDLSRRQYEGFGKIFSRRYALNQVSKLIQNVESYVTEHRKEQHVEKAFYNRTIPLFRKNSIKTDLPTEPGQIARFSLETIRSLTGKAVYNESGQFLSRRCTAGIDEPGMVIGEYIEKMVPGLYAFSIYIKALDASASPVGTFSMGAWIPHFVLYSYHKIESLQPGETLITLRVNISPETASATKEIRLLWEGKKGIEAADLYVEKIT